MWVVFRRAIYLPPAPETPQTLRRKKRETEEKPRPLSPAQGQPRPSLPSGGAVAAIPPCPQGAGAASGPTWGGRKAGRGTGSPRTRSSPGRASCRRAATHFAGSATLFGTGMGWSPAPLPAAVPRSSSSSSAVSPSGAGHWRGSHQGGGSGRGAATCPHRPVPPLQKR